MPVLPLDAKKVIARRAAMELRSGAILNWGVGIPVNVSAVTAEEGVSNDFVLTTEAGSVGGVPAGLKDFGHAYNSQAIVDMDAQFDFYDGGGIDLSVLASVVSPGLVALSISHKQLKSWSLRVRLRRLV